MVGVSVSGFYVWRKRKPSARAVRHAMIAHVVGEVHDASRQTYGARRVHAELLLGRNMSVARCTVELVMRQLGLAGLPGWPKFKKIANAPTAEDLVNRDFARSEPNGLWLTDRAGPAPQRHGDHGPHWHLDSHHRDDRGLHHQSPHLPSR